MNINVCTIVAAKKKIREFEMNFEKEHGYMVHRHLLQTIFFHCYLIFFTLDQ